MRRVAVFTGSRADWGSIGAVMRAVDAHPDLKLLAGAITGHPANDLPQFSPQWVCPPPIMWQAKWLGAAVAGAASWIDELRPDVVCVAGDRVDAFAVASAACLSSTHLAHIHGGERARGVADEALRHAISKMAHLHFPATSGAAKRLRRMGEVNVHWVGSPSLDDLDGYPPLSDEAYAELGSPDAVVLFHPTNRPEDREDFAACLLAAKMAGRVLILEPGPDPGRGLILEEARLRDMPIRGHLQRRDFVGLLRRIRVLVGNSSAGVIECSYLGVPAVDVGGRQTGRPWGTNTVTTDARGAAEAVDTALTMPICRRTTYGSGESAGRIADLLASTRLGPTSKLNAY